MKIYNNNNSEDKEQKGFIQNLKTIFATLIVLKLFGATSLSWMWITAFIWMPLIFIAGTMIYSATMYYSLSSIAKTKKEDDVNDGI